MANYNLTQTGDEVQAYIDSIPVIDVTGTLSGSTITFDSNPYSQIAANYAADCSSIIRLTVGTAVYLLRVTQYDGTNYNAAEMSGAHNVVATIGSSSASATIDAGIDTTPTQGSNNLVTSGGVWEEVNRIDMSLSDRKEKTVSYTHSNMSIAPMSQSKIFSNNSASDIRYFNLGVGKRFMVVCTCSQIATTVCLSNGTSSSATFLKLKERTSNDSTAISYIGETTSTLGYVMLTVDKSTEYHCYILTDALDSIRNDIEKNASDIETLDNSWLKILPINNNYNFENGSTGWSFGGSGSINNKEYTGSSTSGGTQPSIRVTIPYKAGKRYWFYARFTPTALYEGGVTLTLQAQGIMYHTQSLNLNEEVVIADYRDVTADSSTLTYMLFKSGQASTSVITAALTYFAIIEATPDVYLSTSLLTKICEEGSIKAAEYSLKTLTDTETTLLKRAWCAIGDSLTAQASYIAKTVSSLGITSVTNMGVGGRTLADNGSSGMCYDSVLSQIPSTAYLITVMGGTNDWAQNILIGNEEDTVKTTYCGGMNYIIDYISEHYPAARLVIVAPPMGVYPNRTGWTDTSGFLNNNGNSMMDFAEAAYKVANRRAIPCAKVGQMVGWNEKNYSTFLKYDGAYLHPNAVGGGRIAAVLSGFIRTFLPLTEEDV